MTERHLVPISSFLTTTDSGVQPLLSTKQEKDVVDAARMYLRKNHIGINPDVLQRTLGVMGDAARRGLALEGKAFFTPKERMRALIANGLEMREDLRVKAEGFLALSKSEPEIYGDLIGPLALPATLVRAAAVEVNGFALVAEPKAIEEVVNIADQRMGRIDHIAQIGLDHLPEPFTGVTLDRFPTVLERARLIRNMVTSFVFRDSLSPQISTQDLKDFVLQSELAKDMESQADIIAEIAGLTEQPDRAFLQALARQASQLFTVHKTLPNDENPGSVDDFYRHFARGLLLLHPALEEQSIVIIPQRITADAPSIWDDSGIIEGVKVPKVELLAQALRQAVAKADRVNIERLTSGIKAWKLYVDTTKRHNLAVRKAEQDLQEREALFLNLDDPNFELPKEAHFVVYTEQQKAATTLRSTRANAQRLANILKDTTTEIEEIEQYEQYLRQQYPEVLPDFVPIPARVQDKIRLQQRRESIGRRTAIQARITLIEELLDFDLLRSRQSGSAITRLRKEDSMDWLEQQKEQTHKLLEQMETDPEILPFDEQLLKDMQNHLKERFGRKSGLPNIPESLKDIFDFWKDLPKKIVRILRSKDKGRHWVLLVRQILQNRVELLDQAASSVEERKRLYETNTENAEPDKSPADKTLVVEDVFWGKEEALRYIQKTRILKIPESTKLEKEYINRMRIFVLGLALTFLPLKIIGRQSLITWIFGRIKEAQRQASTASAQAETLKQSENPDRKELGKASSRIRRSERRAETYQRLLFYMQHELFPLPEGAGLTRDDFLDAWKKRMNFAYAICYHEDVARENQVAQVVYEQIMRENFKARLFRELEGKRKGLNELKTRNVDKEFVESLRRQNLVLEPSG